MQNPPPPPPMIPPGGAMAVPQNLASPGLRLVGGLIDIIILIVVLGLLEAVTRSHAGSSLVDLAVTLAYFGYFLSSRGQSIGMMVFGFRVRDRNTGQYPSIGAALLRAFIWWLEVGFTICIVGAVGWAWMFWDPMRQGIHDKVAGTIVTTS